VWARPLPVARVKSVRPVVQRGDGKSAWTTVRSRDALFWNSVVRTGPRGHADIIFSNGTLIAMRANSRIQILPRQSASSPLVIRVFGALSEVFVRPRGSTEIRTMAATAAARGTEFLVRLPTEDTAELVVTEGSADFFNPQGRVPVGAGERSFAQMGQAPTPPVRVDVTGLLQWTGDVSGVPLPLELEAFGLPATGPIAQARTLVEGGRSDEARQNLSAVLPQLAGAEAVSANLLLGYLELQRGRAGEAPKYLGAVLDAPGASPAARNAARSYLSLAELSLGEKGAALRQAQQAAREAPRSALAQGALSLAAFFAGDEATARSAAGRAEQLDPLSPFAWLLQGRVALSQNEPARARDAFAQAVALAPQWPLLRVEYARALLATDQLVKAEAEARRALSSPKGQVLEAVPSDAARREATSLLAIALQRRGQTTQARRLFEQVLAQRPDDIFARANYGQLLIENGELAQSREVLAPVVTANPRDEERAELAQVLVRLAEAALYRGELVDAEAFARSGVRLAPRSAPARYQLGRVYVEQERLAQAEQQFRLALMHDPDFEVARYALGLLRPRTDRPLAEAGPLLQGPASIGSQGGASGLRDFLSVGARERVQGFSDDPTNARSASRAYGDTEIGALAGEEANHTAALSHLQLSNDRRGVLGATAERFSSDGFRVNSDRNDDRASVLFGRKHSDGPSSVWAQADYRELDLGRNSGLTDSPFSRSSRYQGEFRRVFGGFTLRNGQSRTRVLALSQDFNFDSPDLQFPRNRFEDELDTGHVELRHDRPLRSNQRLSVGLAAGAEVSRGLIDVFFPPPGGSESILFSTRKRQQALWARHDWRPHPRWRIASEVSVSRQESTSVDVIINPPIGEMRSQAEVSLPAPTLVAFYNAGARTQLRLRAERLVRDIENFRLLAPTDNFFTSFYGVFGERTVTFGNGGRSVELEADHTFGDASLLSVSLFERSTRPSASSSRRARGVQAAYEREIGRNLTAFTRAHYNDARDRPGNTAFFNTPRFEALIGTQYLNRRGYFVQANATYQSAFAYSTGALAALRQGGFGLLNLRAGKRAGVRSSVFIDVANLLDKKYVGSDSQNLVPGRQVRLGSVFRF
jgi:tetratricopeptide (TPR) repeat protein